MGLDTVVHVSRKVLIDHGTGSVRFKRSDHVRDLASADLGSFEHGHGSITLFDDDLHSLPHFLRSALDRLDGWFNTACFSVPNAGFVAGNSATNPGRWQLGNAPRVDPDLRAHSVNNWNLAVSKVTPIQGRVNLTLRAEAFNLFNRTQFGPPNTTVTTAANSTLGRVTTQVNQPRLMQLAFRLAF